MNRMSFAIAAASAFVLVYVVGMHTVFPMWLALLVFSLSPIPLCWMVYSILKHGTPSQLTFSEAMYEDLRIPYQKGLRDFE